MSVLAAITPEELVERVSATDIANGFLNRFLVVAVRREHLLPNGAGIPGDLVAHFVSAFEALLRGAPSEMRRDEHAAELWAHAYEYELSVDRHGLAGAACSRAEAHTLRLSMLYALLDHGASDRSIVRAEHVAAASTLWRYCEQSTFTLFGDTSGDQDADRIVAALRLSSDGLTKTEVRDLFGRHKSQLRLDARLRDLEGRGVVEWSKEATRGRSAVRYRLVERAASDKSVGSTSDPCVSALPEVNHSSAEGALVVLHG